LHFHGTEKSGGHGGPAVLTVETDIALYSFKRMLVVLVGRIMATLRLRLSLDLMGKLDILQSVERGDKATSCVASMMRVTGTN